MSDYFSMRDELDLLYAGQDIGVSDDLVNLPEIAQASSDYQEPDAGLFPGIEQPDAHTYDPTPAADPQTSAGYNIPKAIPFQYKDSRGGVFDYTDDFAKEYNQEIDLFPEFAKFAKGQENPPHAELETYRQFGEMLDDSTRRWKKTFDLKMGDAVEEPMTRKPDGSYEMESGFNTEEPSFEEKLLRSKFADRYQDKGDGFKWQPNPTIGEHLQKSNLRPESREYWINQQTGASNLGKVKEESWEYLQNSLEYKAFTDALNPNMTEDDRKYSLKSYQESLLKENADFFEKLDNDTKASAALHGSNSELLTPGGRKIGEYDIVVADDQLIAKVKSTDSESTLKEEEISIPLSHMYEDKTTEIQKQIAVNNTKLEFLSNDMMHRFDPHAAMSMLAQDPEAIRLTRENEELEAALAAQGDPAKKANYLIAQEIKKRNPETELGAWNTFKHKAGELWVGLQTAGSGTVSTAVIASDVLANPIKYAINRLSGKEGLSGYVAKMNADVIKDTMRESGSSELNPSYSEQITNEALRTIGEMVPQMVAGRFINAGQAKTLIDRLVRLSPMGIEVYGRSFGERMKNAHDLEQQADYIQSSDPAKAKELRDEARRLRVTADLNATLNVANELGTELVFRDEDILFRGFRQKAIDYLFKTPAENAIEEGLASVLSPVVDALSGDKIQPITPGHDMVVGAVVPIGQGAVPFAYQTAERIYENVTSDIPLPMLKAVKLKSDPVKIPTPIPTSPSDVKQTEEKSVGDVVEEKAIADAEIAVPENLEEFHKKETTGVEVEEPTIEVEEPTHTYETESSKEVDSISIESEAPAVEEQQSAPATQEGIAAERDAALTDPAYSAKQDDLSGGVETKPNGEFEQDLDKTLRDSYVDPNDKVHGYLFDGLRRVLKPLGFLWKGFKDAGYTMEVINGYGINPGASGGIAVDTENKKIIINLSSINYNRKARGGRYFKAAMLEEALHAASPDVAKQFIDSMEPGTAALVDKLYFQRELRDSDITSGAAFVDMAGNILPGMEKNVAMELLRMVTAGIAESRMTGRPPTGGILTEKNSKKMTQAAMDALAELYGKFSPLFSDETRMQSSSEMAQAYRETADNFRRMFGVDIEDHKLARELASSKFSRASKPVMIAISAAYKKLSDYLGHISARLKRSLTPVERYRAEVIHMTTQGVGNLSDQVAGVDVTADAAPVIAPVTPVEEEKTQEEPVTDEAAPAEQATKEPTKKAETKPAVEESPAPETEQSAGVEQAEPSTYLKPIPRTERSNRILRSIALAPRFFDLLLRHVLGSNRYHSEEFNRTYANKKNARFHNIENVVLYANPHNFTKTGEFKTLYDFGDVIGDYSSAIGTKVTNLASDLTNLPAGTVVIKTIGFFPIDPQKDRDFQKKLEDKGIIVIDYAGDRFNSQADNTGYKTWEQKLLGKHGIPTVDTLNHIYETIAPKFNAADRKALYDLIEAYILASNARNLEGMLTSGVAINSFLNRDNKTRGMAMDALRGAFKGKWAKTSEGYVMIKPDGGANSIGIAEGSSAWNDATSEMDQEDYDENAVPQTPIQFVFISGDRAYSTVAQPWMDFDDSRSFRIHALKINGAWEILPGMAFPRAATYLYRNNATLMMGKDESVDASKKDEQGNPVVDAYGRRVNYFSPVPLIAGPPEAMQKRTEAEEFARMVLNSPEFNANPEVQKDHLAFSLDVEYSTSMNRQIIMEFNPQSRLGGGGYFDNFFNLDSIVSLVTGKTPEIYNIADSLAGHTYDAATKTLYDEQGNQVMSLVNIAGSPTAIASHPLFGRPISIGSAPARTQSAKERLHKSEISKKISNLTSEEDEIRKRGRIYLKDGFGFSWSSIPAVREITLREKRTPQTVMRGNSTYIETSNPEYIKALEDAGAVEKVDIKSGDYERLSQINSEKDVLRKELFQSKEWSDYKEEEEREIESKKLQEHSMLLQDVVSDASWDVKPPDKIETSEDRSGESIRASQFKAPSHSVGDIDDVEEILRTGLRSGTAIDETENKDWAEYGISLIVPHARKGERIEHNDYYTSRGLSAVGRVIIDRSIISVSDEKINQLASKFPLVKFESIEEDGTIHTYEPSESDRTTIGSAPAVHTYERDIPLFQLDSITAIENTKMPKDRKLNPNDIIGRLRNILTPSEFSYLLQSGIEKFLNDESRTLSEVSDWIKENVAMPQVHDYGMEGKVSDARREYDKMKHEYDTEGRFPTFVPGRDIQDPENLTVSFYDTRRNKDTGPLKVTEEEYQRALRWDELGQEIANEQTDTSPRATSAYEGVSALPVNQPMPEWTKTKSRKNVQRVDVVIPRKTVDSKTYPWKSGSEQESHEIGKGKALEPVMWQQDNLHENLPNTLGWAMLQYKTGPNGEKIAIVAEAQSQWGQALREEKNITEDDRRAYHYDKTPEHPLLKDYNRLILKAAIDQARKEGATHIMISDAETAMITEGHDESISVKLQPEEIVKRINSPGNPDDWSAKITGKGNKKVISIKTQYGETEESISSDPNYSYSLTALLNDDSLFKHVTSLFPEAKPNTEGGMRLNYDTILPKMAEELTGSKGEKVGLGEHKNAILSEGEGPAPNGVRVTNNGDSLFMLGEIVEEGRFHSEVARQIELGNRPPSGVINNPPRYRENLIFKNPDGTPKTDISGMMYRIPAERTSPYSVFGRKSNPNIIYSAPVAHTYEKPLTKQQLLASGNRSALDALNTVQLYADEFEDLARYLANHPVSEMLKRIPVKMTRVGYSWYNSGNREKGISPRVGLTKDAPTGHMIHEIAHAATSEITGRELIDSGITLNKVGYDYINTMRQIADGSHLRIDEISKPVRDIVKAYVVAFDSISSSIKKLSPQYVEQGWHMYDESYEVGEIVGDDMAMNYNKPFYLPYGLTNIDEFIAEALSTKDFMAWLNGIEMPGKQINKSVFRTLINAIRKILGLSVQRGSVLEVAVITSAHIMSAQAEDHFKRYPTTQNPRVEDKNPANPLIQFHGIGAAPAKVLPGYSKTQYQRKAITHTYERGEKALSGIIRSINSKFVKGNDKKEFDTIIQNIVDTRSKGNKERLMTAVEMKDRLLRIKKKSDQLWFKSLKKRFPELIPVDATLEDNYEDNIDVVRATLVKLFTKELEFKQSKGGSTDELVEAEQTPEDVKMEKASKKRRIEIETQVRVMFSSGVIWDALKDEDGNWIEQMAALTGEQKANILNDLKLLSKMNFSDLSNKELFRVNLTLQAIVTDGDLFGFHDLVSPFRADGWITALAKVKKKSGDIFSDPVNTFYQRIFKIQERINSVFRFNVAKKFWDRLYGTGEGRKGEEGNRGFMADIEAYHAKIRSHEVRIGAFFEEKKLSVDSRIRIGIAALLTQYDPTKSEEEEFIRRLIDIDRSIEGMIASGESTLKTTADVLRNIKKQFDDALAFGFDYASVPIGTAAQMVGPAADLRNIAEGILTDNEYESLLFARDVFEGFKNESRYVKTVIFGEPFTEYVNYVHLIPKSSDRSMHDEYGKTKKMLGTQEAALKDRRGIPAGGKAYYDLDIHTMTTGGTQDHMYEIETAYNRLMLSHLHNRGRTPRANAFMSMFGKTRYIAEKRYKEITNALESIHNGVTSAAFTVNGLLGSVMRGWQNMATAINGLFLINPVNTVAQFAAGYTGLMSALSSGQVSGKGLRYASAMMFSDMKSLSNWVHGVGGILFNTTVAPTTGLVSSLAGKYSTPLRKITAQDHLFARTRDIVEGMAPNINVRAENPDAQWEFARQGDERAVAHLSRMHSKAAKNLLASIEQRVRDFSREGFEEFHGYLVRLFNGRPDATIATLTFMSKYLDEYQRMNKVDIDSMPAFIKALTDPDFRAVHAANRLTDKVMGNPSNPEMRAIAFQSKTLMNSLLSKIPLLFRQTTLGLAATSHIAIKSMLTGAFRTDSDLKLMRQNFFDAAATGIQFVAFDLSKKILGPFIIAQVLSALVYKKEEELNEVQKLARQYIVNRYLASYRMKSQQDFDKYVENEYSGQSIANINTIQTRNAMVELMLSYFPAGNNDIGEWLAKSISDAAYKEHASDYWDAVNAAATRDYNDLSREREVYVLRGQEVPENIERALFAADVVRFNTQERKGDKAGLVNPIFSMGGGSVKSVSELTSDAVRLVGEYGLFGGVWNTMLSKVPATAPIANANMKADRETAGKIKQKAESDESKVRRVESIREFRNRRAR